MADSLYPLVLFNRIAAENCVCRYTGSVYECIYATARDCVCFCVRVEPRVLLCAVNWVDCQSAVDVRVVETFFHKTYYLTLYGRWTMAKCFRKNLICYFGHFSGICGVKCNCDYMPLKYMFR